MRNVSAANSCRFLDRRRSPQITFAEFEKWMQKVAQRRHLYVPTKDDVKVLIDEAGVDGNGSINFEEFCAMMECDPTKLHEACAKGRWSAVRKRLHTGESSDS